MSRTIKRWVSIALLGMLAFSQATLALAACGIDRASLAQALAGDMHDCCETEGSSGNIMPMTPSSCLSEGTSDLQAAGAAAAAVVPAAASPVLFVQQPHRTSLAAARLSVPRSPPIPARILLHSFLI